MSVSPSIHEDTITPADRQTLSPGIADLAAGAFKSAREWLTSTDQIEAQLRTESLGKAQVMTPNAPEGASSGDRARRAAKVNSVAEVVFNRGPDLERLTSPGFAAPARALDRTHAAIGRARAEFEEQIAA